MLSSKKGHLKRLHFVLFFCIILGSALIFLPLLSLKIPELIKLFQQLELSRGVSVVFGIVYLFVALIVHLQIRDSKNE